MPAFSSTYNAKRAFFPHFDDPSRSSLRFLLPHSGGQTPKTECRQGRVSSEGSRGGPVLASPCFRQLSAHGGVTALFTITSSSGFGPRRSRPCLRVHMASSSSVHLSFLSMSLKRILVTGFRAHPDNPGWLPGNLIASSETLFTHKVTFTGSMNVMWAYLLGVTIQAMEGGNCLF